MKTIKDAHYAFTTVEEDTERFVNCTFLGCIFSRNYEFVQCEFNQCSAISGTLVQCTSLGEPVEEILENPECVYVDCINGSDETGDGTVGSPFSTLDKWQRDPDRGAKIFIKAYPEELGSELTFEPYGTYPASNAIANEITREYPSSKLPEEINDPQWDKTTQVHDWRNYVDDVVREHWDALNEPGKLAIYLVTRAFADREEWD